MSEILVGVPCYNGADDLLPWCLQAIRDRSGSAISYDLVVVDDSGRPDHRARSRAVAERFSAQWLCHDRNKGIAASWNSLCRWGDMPLIALLNDDLIVAKGWLEATCYALRENPHAGTVSLHFNFITREDIPGLLANPEARPPARDPFSKAPRPDDDEHGVPGKVMCPAGCCFAFTRDKFNLVGGFDECYLFGHEESDYGTALASRGFPSYCLPWPTLGHIWSATMNRSPELQDGRAGRGHDRYVQKWGGHFEHTDPLYMARCPERLTRWLGPEGPRECMK